jgi:hypothetical protein
MEDSYFIQHEDELLGQDWLELYATEILDAKYQWTVVRDVVENQHHLTARQKCDLLDILKHHQKLFDGTLGVYPHKKVHIEIEPDVKPVHA